MYLSGDSAGGAPLVLQAEAGVARGPMDCLPLPSLRTCRLVLVRVVLVRNGNCLRPR